MKNDIVIPLQRIDPKEKKNNGELSQGELVNSFLHLANQHWKTIEIENIGAALREVTAIFNAYEVNMKSFNLQGDREDAIYWFTQEFSKLLANNIDQHIENP
jgi:hypothetical protein